MFNLSLYQKVKIKVIKNFSRQQVAFKQRALNILSSLMKPPQYWLKIFHN